jgi:hypothetical protein
MVEEEEDERPIITKYLSTAIYFLMFNLKQL